MRQNNHVLLSRLHVIQKTIDVTQKTYKFICLGRQNLENTYTKTEIRYYEID